MTALLPPDSGELKVVLHGELQNPGTIRSQYSAKRRTAFSRRGISVVHSVKGVKSLKANFDELLVVYGEEPAERGIDIDIAGA
ncbi:MAG: hypothetical protein WB974_17675, partial [Acidobacteriaceae bacterium]